MKTEIKQKLMEFSKLLDFNISKLELLKEALTHRSYVNEIKSDKEVHNERLEFMGDAVLELVVTEYLFTKYAKYKEGDLTSFRAALVKTESLAEEALRLNIGVFIYMSKGEEHTGGRNRPYILANTMEAVIGALYLSEGYGEASKFIIKNICYKAENIIKERLDIDSKSRLQELAQEVFKITPNYVLKSSVGPDHNKTFEMAVIVGDKEFAVGVGKSKQESEQDAARKVLSEWDKLVEGFKN